MKVFVYGWGDGVIVIVVIEGLVVFIDEVDLVVVWYEIVCGRWNGEVLIFSWEFLDGFSVLVVLSKLGKIFEVF